MKKILLLLLALSFQLTHAQINSIVPDVGNYGQTLTTTITLSSGVMSMSSPPQQMNDIYLQKGNTFIYATNFSLYPGWPQYADSISATFDIPMVTPAGLYDVHVNTYYGPFNPTPIDNYKFNAFRI